MISETQIVFWILETVLVLLYLSCVIRKSHYVKTEAQIIHYHVNRDSLRDGIRLMDVTYRYFQNGTEYTEGETVCISKRKLAGITDCQIYVNPNNGKKFVTPFQIAMWRNMSLIVTVLLSMSIMVDAR